MKKRARNIWIAALALVAVGTTATACATTSSKEGKGPEYEYEYHAPLRAECDSFMTIDGKLDEDIWKDQKYLCWIGGKGNEIKATTVFTSKGLYVGFYAEDDNITWANRYAYDGNSNIKIQVVKEDEINYKGSRSNVHPTRQFVFNIDAKNTLSRMERRYDAKAYVEGELNGETEYMSAELFMPWSEMGYSDDDLAENGCPKAVKLLIQYWTQTGTSGRPGLTDDNRFSTYYTYDENGSTCAFDVDSDTESVGYSVNGDTPGDQWIVDEENKTATNTVDRTQTLWFRKDVDGNKIVASSNYVASVKVKSVQIAGMYPHVGLMTMSSRTIFSIYGVSTSSVPNGKISVSAARETDGGQWVSTTPFSKVYKDSGYNGMTVGDMTLAKDEVYLTVAKRGATLYYFVNGEYVGYEYDVRVGGDCVVGVFANGQTIVSDWSYKDYGDDVNGLDDYLRQHVWFVNVSDNGAGYATTDKSAVKHGDSVNITVTPKIGYVLTKLTVNGEDKFEEFRDNAKNAVMTIVPTEDLTVDAEFSKIPSANVIKVALELKDADSGEALLGASYVIRGNNNLFVYSGDANSSGYIVGSLIKAGTYSLGGITLEASGEYTLEINCSGYPTKTYSISLPSDYADASYEKTYEIAAHPYGKATVNGVTVSGDAVCYEYENADESVFTVQTSAVGGNQYVRAAKFSGNYAFEGKVTLTSDALLKKEGNVWTAGAVSGFIFNAGGPYIEMKTAAWIAGKLYLKNGSAEIGLSNFPVVNDGATTSNFRFAGDSLQFKVIRYNNVMYVYNVNGVLCFALSRDGIDLVNCSIVEGANNLNAFNSAIKAYFDAGEENVIGMYRITSGLGGVSSKYELDYTDDSTVISEKFSAATVTLKAGETYKVSAESKYDVDGGILKGVNATLTFTEVPNNGSSYLVVVKYANGTEEKQNGTYDADEGTYSVTFPLNDDATVWLESYGLGTVKVNGVKTQDPVGGLLSATANGGYKNDYDDTTNIRQYFADKKASGDWSFEATITVVDKDPAGTSGIGSGVGVMISAGGDNALAFFSNSWEGNNLIVNRGGNRGGDQITVKGGFPRDNSLTKVGSQLIVKAKREGDVLYFYNRDDTLVFHMDKDGIFADASGVSISGTDITKGLILDTFNNMISAGKENAFGIYREINNKGAYEWQLTLTSGSASEASAQSMSEIELFFDEKKRCFAI